MPFGSSDLLAWNHGPWTRGSSCPERAGGPSAHSDPQRHLRWKFLPDPPFGPSSRDWAEDARHRGSGLAPCFAVSVLSPQLPGFDGEVGGIVWIFLEPRCLWMCFSRCKAVPAENHIAPSGYRTIQVSLGSHFLAASDRIWHFTIWKALNFFCSSK